MRYGWVGVPSVAVLVLAACSSPSRAVRPAAPTFAEATGSSSCKMTTGRNEPFIVDWPAGHRADFEALAKEHVPVVAYSCDTLRLLPDCEMEGAYRFVGVTMREETLKLEDGDEMRANLPFSGSALAGKLSAEIERGSSVDIGYAIIGKRVSTTRHVQRPALKGRCEGATHFVRSTTIGAFAMTVGTKAKTRAAAEIFTANASGGSGSSRLARSRDGQLEACRRSSSEAPSPVEGCSAPIRIELKSIDAPEPASEEAPVACPSGLVPMDDGKCARPSAKPHVCHPDDVTECEAQCTRGSPASCALYARRLQLGAGVPRDPERAIRLYDKACTGGATPACGRLGEHLVAAGKAKEGAALLQRSCAAGWVPACTMGGALALSQRSKVDVLALFKRGCDGGDPEGCWSLGVVQSQGVGVPKNDAEALKYFAAACDGGAKRGCVDYAKAIDEGRGTPSDPARAAKLLAAACDTGLSEACASLAMMHFTGRGVPKSVEQGVGLLQRACDGTDVGACFVLGMRYQSGVGVPQDPARAKVLLDKACTAGLETACRPDGARR